MTEPNTGQPGWSASTPDRPGPRPGMHYAGFWVRFIAFILDAVVLGIVTAALAPLIGSGTTLVQDAGRAVLINYTANAYGALFGLVYFVGFWAWRGQTPGMMAFSMQVVSATDGEKIDVVRALLRYVGLVISVIPLFLGLIWAAFDARKQGWHDKIAGTFVIRPN